MGEAFTYRQKWISVIVAIRPVFPDPVTYIYIYIYIYIHDMNKTVYIWVYKYPINLFSYLAQMRGATDMMKYRT